LALAVADLLRQGATGTAGLLEACAAEIDASTQLRALVGELEETVASQQRDCGQLYLRQQRIRRVTLPGEPSEAAPLLPWAENPPPSMVDPLVVVVSQPTAVRALVRHYGWIHDGPNILVRPEWNGHREVDQGARPIKSERVLELVDDPGSIAEHAAAAAALVE
jgi:hypothetical protein